MRSGRELTRAYRFCKPLRYHSSITNFVRPGGESNPRIAVLQTVALTTSPPGHLTIFNLQIFNF